MIDFTHHKLSLRTSLSFSWVLAFSFLGCSNKSAAPRAALSKPEPTQTSISKDTSYKTQIAPEIPPKSNEIKKASSKSDEKPKNSLAEPKALDSEFLENENIELKPLKSVSPRQYDVHPSSNHEILYKAESAHNAKNFAEAIFWYRRYLQKDPANVWARLELATNHLINGDQDTAFNILRELRAVNCDLCKSRLRRAAVDERWKELWHDPRFLKVIGPKNRFTDAQKARKRWMLEAANSIRSNVDSISDSQELKETIAHLFTTKRPIRVRGTSFYDEAGNDKGSQSVAKNLDELIQILRNIQPRSGGSDVSCKKRCCSFAPFEHGDAHYGDTVIQLSKICTSGVKEKDWKITDLVFWEDGDYP